MGSAVSGVTSALGIGGKSAGFEARDAARKSRGPRIDKAVKRVGGSGQTKGRYDELFKESRARQRDIQKRDTQLLDQLGGQAAGTAPSLAEAQLKSAQDRNLAQQLAASGRVRGGAQAATQRQLLRNQAASGRQLAQDAAQARMQEQQAAQQTLVGALAQREAASAAQRLGGIQGKQAQNEAERRAIMDYERLNQARYGQALQAGAQQASMGVQQRGALLGSLGTLGAAALSDKSLKKDIKSADTDVKKFLKSIEAKKYKYKDESNGKGEQISPMAQDLEKTVAGKAMVLDTPQGKIVDYGKGFGTIVAAQGELNRRLEELEKRLKK